MYRSQKHSRNACIIIILVFCGAYDGFAQDNCFLSENDPTQLKFYELDSWYNHLVKESFLLGGETKILYKIGKVETESPVDINFKDSDSPWSTTNIYAKMGVEIGNPSVFPEKRGDGFCCRMETNLRKIDILCLNLEVLVSGALFLGDMESPVTNVKNPVRKLNHGIPFTLKPKAIQFDYKYKPGEKRINALYKTTEVEGQDKAELCLILQQRWEDKKGNVFAKRIGGTRQFFTSTNGKWEIEKTLPIYYGNITNEDFYNPGTMGLIPEVHDLYVKNSGDKMVPVVETDWASTQEKPTHLILYFTSSYEGIDFTGSPNSTLWVDNIKFVY